MAVLAVAAMLALLPATAAAQGPGQADDVLVRVGADVQIAEDDTIGTLVVVDGNATIEGTVENAFIVSGDASVAGTIEQTLTVISGDIELQDGATVDDVNSISGNVMRAEGATVTGEINERDRLGGLFGGVFGGAAVLSLFLFWLAATVVLVVAALLFAAIGGRQMTRSALVMTEQAVNAILGAVFFWIGVPILAAIIMLTLVGIPLGVGGLLFLMPAVGFLGYLVAGARLGGAILGRFGREPGQRPLGAAALGVFILQLIALIPFIGWLIATIAGLWGSGALVYVAFSAATGHDDREEPSYEATA